MTELKVKNAYDLLKEEVITTEQGERSPKEYTIAIAGPAKTGKSRLVSAYIEDEVNVSEIIHAPGPDKTKGITQYVLVRKTEEYKEEFKSSYLIQVDNKDPLEFKSLEGVFEILDKKPGSSERVTIKTFMSDFAEEVIPADVDRLILIDTEGAGLDNEPKVPERADHYFITLGNSNKAYAEEVFTKLAPYIAGDNVTYLYLGGSAPNKLEALEKHKAKRIDAGDKLQDDVLKNLKNSETVRNLNLFSVKENTVVYYELPAPEDGETLTEAAKDSYAYSDFIDNIKKRLNKPDSLLGILDEAKDLTPEEREELRLMYKEVLGIGFTRNTSYTSSEFNQLIPNTRGRTMSYDFNDMQRIYRDVREEFVETAYNTGIGYMSKYERSKVKDIFARTYFKLITRYLAYITGGWFADARPRYCQEGYASLLGPFTQELEKVTEDLKVEHNVVSGSWWYVGANRDLLVSEVFNAMHLYYNAEDINRPEIPDNLEDALTLFGFALPIYALIDLRMKSI